MLWQWKHVGVCTTVVLKKKVYIVRVCVASFCLLGSAEQSIGSVLVPGVSGALN